MTSWAHAESLTPRGTQVTDAQLLGMLEKVNEQLPKTGITVRSSLVEATRICFTRFCFTRSRLLGAQINRRRPSLFEDD